MTGFIGVGQLRYSTSTHPPSERQTYNLNSLDNLRAREEQKVQYSIADVYLGAVLTNLGEKMSDEEVDELLKIADTSSGEVNYTGIRCSQ